MTRGIKFCSGLSPESTLPKPRPEPGGLKRVEDEDSFFKCRDTLGAKLNIRYLSQFAVDLPEFKSYVSYFFFLSYAQKLNFFSRRFMGLPDETSFLSVHDRNPRSSTTQNLV